MLASGRPIQSSGSTRLCKSGASVGGTRALLSGSRCLGHLRAPTGGRRQVVAGAGDQPNAELLRQENERLRQQLAARLNSLSPAQRSAVLEQHARLRQSAQAAGVEIPALAGGEAQQRQAAPPVATQTVEPPLYRQPADKVFVDPSSASRSGTPSAQPPASSTTSSPASGTAGTASSVASKNGSSSSSSAGGSAGTVGSQPNNVARQSSSQPPAQQSIQGMAPSQPATAAAGQPNVGLQSPPAPTQATASAGAKPSATTPAQSAASPKPAASVPTPPAQPPAASAASPASQPAVRAAPSTLTFPATSAPASAAPPTSQQQQQPPSPASAAAAAPVRPAAPAPPPPPPAPKIPEKDWSKDRAAANKEVAEHDPKTLAQGRESWLFFTVPQRPVAGADCVVYFNRWQSEPLRHQGRLQLHAKFNTWEVDAPDGERVDMPHEGRINRGEGVDYYSTRVRIPDNAFELNFVISNGESIFDNNSGKNYLVPVDGPMTREKWIDTAPERAEAAWRKKKEEEARKAREEAEAEAARKVAEDERKAEESVAEIKREYANWQKGAVKQEEGRWSLVPKLVQPGNMVKLLYNRLAGPLQFNVTEDQHLTLKIGHNGWKTPVEYKMMRVGTPVDGDAKEEWWEALVTVPRDAACLNFVVFYFEHCDNNGRQDFKALIDLPPKMTVDSWAESLRPEIKKAVTAQREAEEAVAAALEAERKAKRRTAQAKAEAVRRKQMRHVLFTVPEVPKAGEDVTIYYNPNNGGLPGRQSLWIKGGWNRWRHPKLFGAEAMSPPTEGDHFQYTVTVPKDAYYLDFVFTDAPENGTYDSNGGLDFHIPVEGSVVEEPPLHVVHIAVEMAPICKVGGLGDVVTSLSRAVQDQGHMVEVILPRYNFFQQSPLLTGTKYETEFDWGGTKVFVTTCEVEGLRCFFIEPRNGMFDGPVYQGLPDGDRFDFFCRAALEFLLRSGRQPDILHCHDWSSSYVAKSYWEEYNQFGLHKPRVVFTIHNMDFGEILLGEAAYYSQRFTTVSPSYAWEIGGHPGIAPNAAKLRGVRNGIDVDIWDPETDKYLPRGYDSNSVVEGKRAARQELRKRLNMTDWGDKPMVGVVSRLTKQKGTHLIAHGCFRTLDRGGQFVLLGSAPDPRMQAEFDELKNQHGGDQAGFCFAFDEPLSHLIYAACDFILVPSMFEPCGLTQMIAMRYGAVPIVRATGGLKDTIFDVDTDKARAAWEMEGSTDWLADNVDATNGFAFEGMDPGALDYAMNRALDAYYNDRTWFHSLQKRVMEQDWSWNKPAHDYIELYYAALK